MLEKVRECWWHFLNWLVVWLPWILFSQKYWVANHPNWRNHIFQRGGPTTNQSETRAWLDTCTTPSMICSFKPSGLSVKILTSHIDESWSHWTVCHVSSSIIFCKFQRIRMGLPQTGPNLTFIDTIYRSFPHWYTCIVLDNMFSHFSDKLPTLQRETWWHNTAFWHVMGAEVEIEHSSNVNDVDGRVSHGTLGERRKLKWLQLLNKTLEQVAR